MKKGLEEIEGVTLLIPNDDESWTETMIQKETDVSQPRARDDRIKNLVSEIESLKSVASEKDAIIANLWNELFAAENICREREERIGDLRDALEIATLEKTHALRRDLDHRRGSENYSDEKVEIENKARNGEEESFIGRLREECVDSISEVKKRLSAFSPELTAIEEALTRSKEKTVVEEKKKSKDFWTTFALFAFAFLSLFFTKN